MLEHQEWEKGDAAPKGAVNSFDYARDEVSRLFIGGGKGALLGNSSGLHPVGNVLYAEIEPSQGIGTPFIVFDIRGVL